MPSQKQRKLRGLRNFFSPTGKRHVARRGKGWALCGVQLPCTCRQCQLDQRRQLNGLHWDWFDLCKNCLRIYERPVT